MSSTTVVNIYHEPYDVYIGRAGHGQDGYFGNPVRLKQTCPICSEKHYTLGSTLACYGQYFHDRLKTDHEFRMRVEQLRNKKLGCFCRPRGGFNGLVICHGQVVCAYLDGIRPEDVR